MNKKSFLQKLSDLEKIIASPDKTKGFFYYNLANGYIEIYIHSREEKAFTNALNAFNNGLYHYTSPHILSLILNKRACLLYYAGIEKPAYYDAVMACKILPNFQEIKDKLCIDFIKPDLLKKEKVYYYKPIGKSIHKQEAFTLSNIKNKKPCLF